MYSHSIYIYIYIYYGWQDFFCFFDGPVGFILWLRLLKSYICDNEQMKIDDNK